MQIRIEASGFPAGWGDIRVGVQRRNRPAELLGLADGSAPRIAWMLDCAVKATLTGPDVTGPYVQGGPGDRFVYLSWVALDDEVWTMFRRAKLMLADVPADVLADGVDGGLLVGRLSLTDASGGPLCARVRPPTISWSPG